MTALELLRWRTRLGWSQAKAAQQLGVGRRTYLRYEQSDSVPRAIGLACWALENGIDLRID
jgi:transcriptional regulator with XRE-family HTH domain